NKRLVIFLAFFICVSALFAQKPYFQQQVDFKIDVRLDDAERFLHATETITYTNKSPDSLTVIMFHLWPNAYKERSTALTKQQLLEYKTDLYFAKQEERGWIDSLNFTTNGESLKWEYDAE